MKSRRSSAWLEGPRSAFSWAWSLFSLDLPRQQKDDTVSEDTENTNDQLVLISGESSTGKSAALRNLRNPEEWLYLNCEAGKRLPFRSRFQAHKIVDPYQVYEAFDYGTGNAQIKGIIIDTVTFLMDMFESQYIIGSSNTQKAWGDYAQFFKVLMQDKVTRFAKPTLILGHTREELDEAAGVMRRAVPVKGSLKNNGIEAYFSTVVSTKRVQIKDLKDYQSSLLNISPEEQDLGYKHVFQTRPTKATVGERIRSPMGLFDKSQTFMDNDAQILLDHLTEFYKV